MVAPSTESACVLDPSFDLSRDLDHAPSLPRAERGQASGQADRRYRAV